MDHGVRYGRTEDEWQQLEDLGWEFLKEKAGERRGDPRHDSTVSYGEANSQLAARTGLPEFDFGRQADRAAVGYLLGRISRNRSWPASGLLISALVRFQNEADAGSGFFGLAREKGLIQGRMSELERLEFWMRHVRDVQAFDWSGVQRHKDATNFSIGR